MECKNVINEKRLTFFMEPLYLQDCYMKTFEATVSSVKDGKFIVLDKTAFYPNAGGQPYDTGIMKKGDETYTVVFVGKFGEGISHEVDKEGLEVGDTVQCTIDWERRYRLMRMHTAAHVLSRVIYEETGAHTSGNQLGTEKSRIDFTLETFDKEKVKGWIEKANSLIEKNPQVKKSFMSREDALAIPGFAGPSPHLMQGFDTLRVVDITDVDAQPCGGTHIDTLGEIGTITFIKSENKGKQNRRIYFSVD